MLTAEDVVRRIAVECAYLDDHGGVGIRIRPAAAIVRAYGEQFQMRQLPQPATRVPKRRAREKQPAGPRLL